MPITGKLAGAVAAAVGVVTLGAAARADAGLLIDLRPMAINGQPIPPNGNGDSIWALPGDVVSVNIYARVTGANNTNDESFTGIHGVFRSSTGGRLMDLQTTVLAPFNAAGSQNGSQIDIDSDGDLDIGDRPNGGLASTYFVALAAQPVTAGAVVATNPASEEFLIGMMTLTMKPDASGGGEGFVDFIRRRNPGNPGTNNIAYSLWNEDGTGSAGVRNGTSPYAVDGINFQLGPPLEPEPSGLALTSLAATLGLLARRRRTRSMESL